MLVVIGLVLAGLGWWWSGPASDGLVLYPARCVSGTPILPFELTGTRELDLEKVRQDEEKYRQDRANCVIDPYPAEAFKINPARGEVYYKGFVGTARLVDCAIFSRTDWSCVLGIADAIWRPFQALLRLRIPKGSGILRS
jgi:hypothetical protein